MFQSRFARLDIEDFRLPAQWSTRLLTPALLVYLDHVRENLRRLLQCVDGDADRLRLHVKTVKIPQVFSELTRVGIRRFKCATTREALELLRVLEHEAVGGSDLLLAYPLVGPALERLGGLAREYPRTAVSVLCEDPGQVARIPEPLTVFVDVNPGMDRTGVPLDDEARIARIASSAGPRFRGVHFYEGHVHGKDVVKRRRIAHGGYDRLLGVVDRLADRGVAVPEIVTSGTPSFLHALEYTPFRDRGGTVHRVSPGTVVYHDLRTEQEIEELDLLPAALVLATVVSHPSPGVVTCDAGSKSIAAEAGDPCAFVVGRPDLRAMRPSEEHLPFVVDGGKAPARGERLWLIPRHVCPTVNLADRALLVDRRSGCRIVSVDARAHELLGEE